MSNRKAPETEAELLTALIDLFDQVDLDSPEEAEEILRAAGYDLEAVKKEMEDVARQALANSPLNWRNKRTQIEQEQKRASAARRLITDRAGLETAAQALLARLSALQPQAVATHFRNYEEMGDADLASWLEDLELLVEKAEQAKGE